MELNSPTLPLVLFGKGGLVLLLFISSILFSFLRKKTPQGLAFFTGAVLTSILGVVPSKLLMASLVNKVTISLLCLYLVIHTVAQSGLLQEIMGFLVRSSKDKSIKLYLIFSFLGAFIPSRRVQKQILTFMKKSMPNFPLLLSSYFPAVFILASCLTLVGSITNLVADEILSETLGGRRSGFLVFGSISVPLFFLSILFFVWAESRKIQEKKFSNSIWFSRVESYFGWKKKKVVLQPAYPLVEKRALQESVDFSSAFSKEEIEKQIPSYKKITNKKHFLIGAVFFLLIGSTMLGMHLFLSSSLAAIFLFFLGAIKKDIVKDLPLDVFLLVFSAFIFSHAFNLSGLTDVLARGIEELCLFSPLLLLSFFLAAAATISFFIPSVLAVALLLPPGLKVFASAGSKHVELIAAAITLGSFFFFPKKLFSSLEKEAHIRTEKQGFNVLQLLWILMVYAVFLIRHYFLTA